MKQRKIHFSLSVVFLICAFTHCSGLATSAAEVETEVETTDSTYDNLSDTETDLYEDGPVEMPVTIAKLESPDAYLIRTEIAETESCSTAYDFTISGEAQSIRNVSKAYLYVPTTGESSVVELEADGSFGPLTVCSDDEVVMSAMDDGETQVSPPLVFGLSAVEEDGERRLTPILKDTNSVLLDGNFNVIVDDAGNFYMVLQYDSGLFSLVRKNTDGSLIETLLENHVAEPLQVSVISGDKVVVLSLSGKISLLTRDAVLGTWSQSATLVDVGETTFDFQQLQKYRVMLTGSEDAFLLRRPPNKGDGTLNTSLLDLVTLTGEVTELVTASEYDDLVADRGAGDEFHVLTRSSGASQYVLNKIDAALGADAWTQKTVEIEEFTPEPGWSVRNIDASENSVVLIDTNRDFAPAQLYLWSSASGLEKINDVLTDPFGFYETPHISREGNLVVLCKIEPPGEVNGGQIAIHRPGIDGVGEIYSIVDDYQVNSYCDPLRQQRFFVDTNGLIHFYQMPIQSPTEMQHGMLNANNIDLLKDLF